MVVERVSGAAADVAFVENKFFIEIRYKGDVADNFFAHVHRLSPPSARRPPRLCPSGRRKRSWRPHS